MNSYNAICLKAFNYKSILLEIMDIIKTLMTLYYVNNLNQNTSKMLKIQKKKYLISIFIFSKYYKYLFNFFI